MDRETLNRALGDCPIRIKMNNGEEFTVPSREHALVSDLAIDVLSRGEDGKLRNVLLSLVAICSVEPLASTADNS